MSKKLEAILVVGKCKFEDKILGSDEVVVVEADFRMVVNRKVDDHTSVSQVGMCQLNSDMPLLMDTHKVVPDWNAVKVVEDNQLQHVLNEWRKLKITQMSKSLIKILFGEVDEFDEVLPVREMRGPRQEWPGNSFTTVKMTFTKHQAKGWGLQLGHIVALCNAGILQVSTVKEVVKELIVKK